MNTIKEHDLINEVSKIAKDIFDRYLINGKLKLPKICKDLYYKIDVNEHIKQLNNDDLWTSGAITRIDNDDESISIVGNISMDEANHSVVDSMNNPITTYKSYETYKDKNGDWAWLSKKGLKSDIGWSWIDNFKKYIESVQINILPHYINKETEKLETKIWFKIAIKK